MEMPKMKTKSGATKRFKMTASETAFKYLDFKAFKASMVMSFLLINELSQQYTDASLACVNYI